MRLLQVSNIVSHHQLPLARCLAARLGESNFRFAATEVTTTERVNLGWNAEESEPWILRAGENEADLAQFHEWWSQADVVIAGCRTIPQIADRVRSGKLTFYMSERWWKPLLGIARLLHPRFMWMAYQFCQLARSSNFHYLPIGGYAASDIRRIASFQGRVWDWGYFTTVPDPIPPCLACDSEFRVLWAGRMLSCKRVDTLVRAFALLLQKAPNSHLTLLGDGPCRESLNLLVKKLGLGNNVNFHHSVPASQIRQWMRNTHVYVLSSNGYEGWGAVLNEAMSEGCAMVASEAAGSAKTILRHGENGLLFVPGDYRRLGDLLIQLSADEPLRRRLAEAGQRTMMEEWSPRVAADRFLAVSEAWLSDRPVPFYPRGPMTSV